MTTIEFYRKDTFGTERLYIVNDTQAQAILTLTGKKTLTKKNIKALQDMGITIIEVPDPMIGK